MHEQRIETVRRLLGEMGLTQMIVSDPRSIQYLTGAYVEPGERFLALVIIKGKAPVLFLNRLFTAPKSLPCEVFSFDDVDNPLPEVAKLLHAKETCGVDKNLAARFLDLAAQGAHDVHEQVGADVRLRLPEDLLGRARVHEPAQHVARERVLDVRRELAVRERAGAALAEAVVAFAIHLLGLRDAGKGFLAFTHVLSTFQDDGAIAQFDESQGGKESARSLSHHDDSRLGAHIRVFRMHILVVLRIFVDGHAPSD